MDAPLPAAVGPGAAFAHRDFRRYLASSLALNLGAQMTTVAVGWQIYALTHRAMSLGLVGLVQFAPVLALTLPGGNVADRLDRGRIVAVCSLTLAVCVAALCALAARHAGPAPIYAVLFFVGVARAFLAPAAQAVVPGLVPVEHFANAVTWTSTTWQVSTIAGPALGGVLYGVAGGATWVYAFAAALMTLAAAAAFSLRPHPPLAPVGQAGALARVAEGLRFVWRRPVILESISLDLFAVLLGGATALLPIFASDILHVGPLGLGLLRSAPAAGAAVTAVGLAYRPLTRRAGPILLVCVALFGVATIAFGLSRSFGLSLAALVVLGGSDMVSVVVRSTVVQLRTPHEMRGRVSAVNMVFISSSNDLGELESGLTAAWLGAVPAVIVGGVGTLVVVAVYTFALGSLRKIDRLEETS
ncbi:MAG TPA: MFS transporter [Polyangia bacterium]|nr:MFS transporter [Polyangia bacterium]